MRCCLHVLRRPKSRWSRRFCEMLTRLVSLLLLGRCPHLTVTLLAHPARMLQGALSAQMFCLKIRNRWSMQFWYMLTRLVSMLLLLGRCLNLTVTPAGPAGPYIAGGPVGPDDCLQVLEPFEELVLDHADPAGQLAVILNTVESLEHAVVENILDGRPLEGITCPEQLEHSLRLLDGGLVEKISDWEPEASPVRTLPWTVDLRRGLLTWTIRLWGCLWTVDSWRGCRVWNHWSSQFLIRYWSHDLFK